jgi:flagellar basal body-associated protein FliL
MENQNLTNTKGSNQTKKTLIICGSIVIVAVIVMVCIFMLQGKKNTNNMEIMDNGAFLSGSEMSFEDFCMGMKKDLPQETMDEVKRLYDAMKQAEKDKDMDRIGEIFEELAQLDVFDNSGFDMISSGSVIITDENGNILKGEDIPDEIKDQIIQEGN